MGFKKCPFLAGFNCPLTSKPEQPQPKKSKFLSARILIWLFSQMAVFFITVLNMAIFQKAILIIGNPNLNGIKPEIGELIRNLKS